MKKCTSYCLAEKFNYKDLINYLENNYKLTKYKEFCIIDYSEWYSFIFEYWTIVNWNLSHDENKKILDEINEYYVWEIDLNIFDEFKYEDDKWTSTKVINDKIYLETDTIEEKIWISYAMSQSIKLSYFESTTIETIEDSKNIPTNLATKGKIWLKSKDISKIRWKLFMVKSRTNLHYDLLDSPDFFWEYPELLKYYETTANYLEIKTRIQVLNKKLEVIHEMFEMLADEQKHNHSSLLEWIIIWLIVIEVFFTIFHDVLKLF